MSKLRPLPRIEDLLTKDIGALVKGDAATSKLRDMIWIKDLEFKDIRDLIKGDAALVYTRCGLHVLIPLLAELPGIPLYLSEKPLFEIKKRYIRKFHDRTDPERNAKALAVLLGVSERFVQMALAETDEHDDRNGDLFESLTEE